MPRPNIEGGPHAQPDDPAPASAPGPAPHDDGPAQACAVAVVRQLTGGGAGGPLWGDEVTVGVEARLDCPAGRV
ncbi:MAG: hypothetical protein DYG90_10480, partial [Chloroflexi bacterium CFX6]|nr:hypothetical protein [Chloroflexi bacterium CFX6]